MKRCPFCGEVDQRAHHHVLGEIYPPWQDRAACKGHPDPRIFYPDKGQSDRQAMLVCFGCEVRTDCLSLALRRPEKDGVWGGSTSGQRNRIRALGLPHLETLELALEITEASAHMRRLFTEEVA